MIMENLIFLDIPLNSLAELVYANNIVRQLERLLQPVVILMYFFYHTSVTK